MFSISVVTIKGSYKQSILEKWEGLIILKYGGLYSIPISELSSVNIQMSDFSPDVEEKKMESILTGFHAKIRKG